MPDNDVLNISLFMTNHADWLMRMTLEQRKREVSIQYLPNHPKKIKSATGSPLWLTIFTGISISHHRQKNHPLIPCHKHLRSLKQLCILLPSAHLSASRSLSDYQVFEGILYTSRKSRWRFVLSFLSGYNISYDMQKV